VVGQSEWLRERKTTKTRGEKDRDGGRMEEEIATE